MTIGPVTIARESERPFGDKPRSADSRPAGDRPVRRQARHRPYRRQGRGESADGAAGPGGFSGKPRGDRPGGKGPGGKSPGSKSLAADPPRASLPAVAVPPGARGNGRCGSSAVSSAAVPWPLRRPNAIRPAIDRTRESLFNILSHAHPGSLDGTRVLDLFAGTGAVGIERCRAAVARRSLSKTASRAAACCGRISMRSVCMAAPRSSAGMPRSSVRHVEHRAVRSSLCRPTSCWGLGEKAFEAAHRGGWLAWRMLWPFWKSVPTLLFCRSGVRLSGGTHLRRHENVLLLV